MEPPDAAPHQSFGWGRNAHNAERGHCSPTWLLAQIEKNRAAPASDVVETASGAPFVPERFAA